ncbi:MAG: sorbitol dehydrogenase [Acidobacteriota bacterium]
MTTEASPADTLELHARLYAPGDLRLSHEPRPRPGPDETLLQVTAVGICGSDLHWFEEGGIGDARLARPLVLGHEIAGVVAEGELRGRPVAVDPAIACEHCRFCHEGHPNLCSDLRFAGHDTLDGGLRRFMAWPSRLLYPVPEHFSAAETAMLEPLGVALHALDLAHIRVASTAAVLGCGPIGLLILQLLRRAGLTFVAATDIRPHRLQAARERGADLVVAAEQGREAREIVAAAGGLGVDVAFEAAGDNEAVEAAVHCVRPGGRVILAGIPPGDRLTLSAGVARRKGLTIKLVRRMKHVYPRAIRLLEQRIVDLESLVTHRFPLAKCPEAFAVAYRREGLKVIVEP